MKLIVVGCGNAFSYKHYNQAFLLEEENRRMLIDCGSRIPIALHDMKIDPKSITDIYISHAHGDHCGGLEEIGFLRYDWMRRPHTYKDVAVSTTPHAHSFRDDFMEYQPMYAPNLICNKQLMGELWDHTLSGGMKSMEGFDASIATYFIPRPIEPNASFMWAGWECRLIQQVHIMTGSVIMSTFGLFMKKEGKPSIFFTTDAQYFQPEQVKVFYDAAQIIFQDCELVGVNVAEKKMVFKSGVHANYAQLAGWPSVNAYKLDDATKAKLHLSHYQDCFADNKDMFGNPVNWQEQATADGFAGFVEVGQVFNI